MDRILLHKRKDGGKIITDKGPREGGRGGGGGGGGGGARRGRRDEEEDAGPRGAGRSYLRVVGVGIVVPPGSVQREQHSWARGPATRWAAPGQQGGAWCFLWRGGRWPGTGQVRRTSLVPRPGWARSLKTETPDPSRTFPEPAAGVRGRWGKGLRKQSCHTQSHTHRHREKYTHVHART